MQGRQIMDESERSRPAQERHGRALERLRRRLEEQDGDHASVLALRAATSYGEAAAADNLSIEEAFERFLGAVGAPEAALRGALLGAIARGYTDYMVKLRGLVRRGGMGVLSSHVARLAALHQINQAATASLDLEAMLNTVVQVVNETVGGDSCSIFLFESATNTLTLRAAVGLNPEAVNRVTIPLGAGITGQAALTRRVLAVADAQSHPAYLDYPLVGDQFYHSQVSVPLALRSPDRLVGVLNILTRSRREFSPDEVVFLETAAGEIAIAIENARLYSETDAELRRRIAQLGTLQQVSRMVASTLELPVLLRVISEQTVELARARAAEIYRRPRDSEVGLELLARYPEEATAELLALNPQVREVVEEVIEAGAAVWRRLPLGDREVYLHAVPMRTGRRSLGAICVFHPSRPVDEQEAQGLLPAFSDAAAVAIENAELYEEARRGLTRASTLLQEMHHRVRNNLQTVAALLSMQARHAGDAAWAAPLNEAVNRIRSIAVIHDVLSGGNLRETTVDTIAKHVADEASVNIVPPGCHVQFAIPPSAVHVSSRQATILALLVNEFVTNAVKHGLAGRVEGRIEIAAEQTADGAVLTVRDDGVGIPEGFDPTATSGLGLQIARTLAEVDLRGALAITRDERGGTRVEVRFQPMRSTDE